MTKKILIGIVAYCVLFMTISALATNDVYAQKRPPKKARKLKQTGDRLFNARNYQGAIGKYAEAIIITDNYADAHFWKGFSHFNVYSVKEKQGEVSGPGELKLALNELNAASKQGYEPLDIYKVRWIVNYKLQNFNEALQDVENGLRLDPNDLTLQAGLADVYYGKQDYRAAVDAYVRVVDKIPNNGNVYYNMANAHFNLGDSAEQKVNAQKAIENRTQYIGASYYLIGDALQKERDLKAAAEAYELSLNTRDDIKQLYINLSDVYRTQNRFQEAIEIVKKGLRIFPNDGALYVDLSWYQSLADQHKDAIGSAQRAIALVPDNYMAHTNLCRGYNDIKEYNLAIQACNMALQINQGDGETNYYLGRAYAGLKNKPRAAEYYKKSIAGLIDYTQDFPYYADGYYLLGNAYYEDNQNKQAIDAYERSLALSPKFTKAMFNLGVAYFVDQKMDKAKEQYSKLLNLDVDEAQKLGKILNVK